jgi:hypothetical protein
MLWPNIKMSRASAPQPSSLLTTIGNKELSSSKVTQGHDGGGCGEPLLVDTLLVHLLSCVWWWWGKP